MKKGWNVRYQQTYQGIPVMGGELIVNTNENGDLYSINGEVSPGLSLPIQPANDSEQARQMALQSMAKWCEKTPEDFVVLPLPSQYTVRRLYILQIEI